MHICKSNANKKILKALENKGWYSLRFILDKLFQSKNTSLIHLCFITITTLIGISIRVVTYNFVSLLSRDSISYITAVEHMQANNSFSTAIASHEIFSAPLLSYIMLLLANLFPISPESSGIIVNFVFGIALIPLVYLLSWKIFNSYGIAFFSSLFVALHCELIEYSIQVQRESMFLFFAGVAILVSINGLTKNSSTQLFLAGFCFALSFFTRYEAIELLFLLVIFIIFTSNQKDRRKNIFNSLLLILGFTISASIITMILGINMSIAQKMFERIYEHLPWI